jgi:excisionase family DNA binding protein
MYSGTLMCPAARRYPSKIFSAWPNCRAVSAAARASKKLGVSRHTVYKWIRQKHLSAYRLGHEMRITESALKEFLEERRTDREER